jgi:hypothetical protein
LVGHKKSLVRIASGVHFGARRNHAEAYHSASRRPLPRRRPGSRAYSGGTTGICMGKAGKPISQDEQDYQDEQD